jgi:hypothetical protein
VVVWFVFVVVMGPSGPSCLGSPGTPWWRKILGLLIPFPIVSSLLDCPVVVVVVVVVMVVQQASVYILWACVCGVVEEEDCCVLCGGGKEDEEEDMRGVVEEEEDEDDPSGPGERCWPLHLCIPSGGLQSLPSSIAPGTRL